MYIPERILYLTGITRTIERYTSQTFGPVTGESIPARIADPLPRLDGALHISLSLSLSTPSFRRGGRKMPANFCLGPPSVPARAIIFLPAPHCLRGPYIPAAGPHVRQLATPPAPQPPTPNLAHHRSGELSKVPSSSPALSESCPALSERPSDPATRLLYEPFLPALRIHFLYFVPNMKRTRTCGGGRVKIL